MTKVVVATQPEATFVLDEILGNQTDLPIAEHATDTAGASLVIIVTIRKTGSSRAVPTHEAHIEPVRIG